MFCPAFTSNSVFGFSAPPNPTLVRLADVGEGPVDLEVFGSGATTRVYCCNYFDGTVSVLDPSQPLAPVVSVIPVGEGPVDLVRDGTLLYVANSISGSISIIDTTTNTTLPNQLQLP